MHNFDWSAVAGIGSLVAALMSIWNHRHIKIVHAEINSKFTEYLRLRGEASFAKGVLEGSKQEREKGHEPSI